MRDHAGFLFLYLNDSKVFERLYNYDKSFAEKFINAVKRAIEKLRRFFKENATYARTEYGKALQEAMSKVENRVQELWDEAVAQGIRAENKESGSERFDSRENTSISEEDLPDYLKVGERKHVRNSKQKIIDAGESPFLLSKQEIRSFIDLSHKGKTEDTIKAYGRVGRNLADDIMAVDDKANDVAGYYLELDGNRFIHFKDHIEFDNDSRNIPLTYEEILNLTDYIDNYSEILDCIHKKDGSVRAHIAYEDNDGVVVIVELISKGRKSLQPVTAWKNTKEAFHLIWDQKKKAPTTSRAAQKSASSGYISASKLIIPDNSGKINTTDESSSDRFNDTDYLSAVKRGDMKTAQQMVDEAAERAFKSSKIRDDNGKLIKVYHGTEEDFNVFDKTKGRANMDIQGMFFSPWELDAQGYGSNVKAFYLNITNPADESTGYRALNGHKGENNAGVKAREDLVRMGYDGVNNSDEEYISFDSSQIKSADPVTYDDDGNVIPLSERFNEEKEDIRYQDRYDEYDDLFDMGEDLFEDSSKREIFDEMIEKYPYEALALSVTPKKI